MNTIQTIALVLVPASLAACGLFEEDDIPISEVPAPAVEAAQSAVDGIQLKSAEAKTKDGRTVYEIDGNANGVKHEVRVTSDGEVLKVKTE